MAWFMDTYSVYQGYAVPEIVTGKPVSVGGTSGRRESTGRGVVYLIERALNVLKMQPDRCTAVVQGFGNVGAVAALGLAYKNGMKVIGISDAFVALHRADGIDIDAAEKYAAQHGSLAGFPGADPISPDELLALECDVLVPAAVGGVTANAVSTTGRARRTVASTIASRRLRPCETSVSIWSTRMTALRMIMPAKAIRPSNATKPNGALATFRASDAPMMPSGAVKNTSSRREKLCN